jgi:hypothetical protein
MSFVDKAKDAADDLKGKAGDLAEKVSDKIPDSVKETASDLKEKAGELVDTVKDKLGIGEHEAETESEETAIDRLADPTDPTTTETSA